MATMMSDGHKMSGEQAAILQDLCEKTGHPFSDQLTAAKAQELIDELSAEVEGTDLPEDE